MNDLDFEEMQDRVMDCFLSWLPVFGLQNWRFQHSFHRGAIPGFDELAMAVTEPSAEYMTADIDWNLSQFGDDRLLSMDECVVHELLHCVLSPMVNTPSNFTHELVTTHVSRIILATKERAGGER